MSAIDFCEIAQANTFAGDQDHFGLFARDLLASMNFEIAEPPAMGSDGGKDLIVVEKYQNELRSFEYRWLVSCKHFAHSTTPKGKGRAVGPNDESDILERLEAFGCSGFIGFYSTLPSEGLMQRLRGLESGARRFSVMDSAKIESLIVGIKARRVLFKRYFPVSYAKWTRSRRLNEPARLFDFYFSQMLETERPAFPILKQAFGLSQDIIKPLRTSASLEDLLAEKGYLFRVASEDAVRMIIRSEARSCETVNDLMVRVLGEEFGDSEQFGDLLEMRWNARTGCWVILSAGALISERAYGKAREDFAQIKAMLD